MPRHRPARPGRKRGKANPSLAGLRAENRALQEELGQLQRREAALRQSQKQFAAFLENTTALAWMKDERLRVVYFNPACERFRQTSAATAVGRRSAQFFGPKIARQLEAHDRQVLRENRPVVMEQTVPSPDGTPTHWRVLRFPHVDEAGRRFVGGMALDITDYLQTSHALRKANEETVTILNHITDGFVALDHQWCFTYINRHAAQTIARLGKRPQALTGKCLWDEFPDLLSTPLEREFRRAAATRTPVAFEFHYPPLKGWFQLNTYSSDDGLVVYFNEITERKQVETTLRALPGRVLAAQEAERHRVARELHDGVNQLLSTAQFRMQGIESFLQTGATPLGRAIRGTAKILEQAVKEVRRISQNLRPSELDHLGLAPAIQSACHAFQERTGIQVDFDYQRPHKLLPPDIKLAIYRIVQEALNNVEKHARATRVMLRWKRKDRTLHLVIRDDGRGFDASTKGSRRKTSRGFGLLNMRERATMVGGNLVIDSHPRKGTKIDAWLPMEKRAAGKVAG